MRTARRRHPARHLSTIYESASHSCVMVARRLCLITRLILQQSQEAFPASLSPFVLPAVRRTLSHLQSLGATLVPVSLPAMGEPALSAYYVIASAEASSNLAKFDGARYGTLASHQRRNSALRVACRLPS